MVDDNGDAASYTPVTNRISEVELRTYKEIWSNYGNGETYSGTSYDQTKMWNTLLDSNNCTLGKNNGTAFFVWEFPGGIPFDPRKLSMIGARLGSAGTGDLLVNGVPVTNISSFPVWTQVGSMQCQFADYSLLGNELYSISFCPWTSKGIGIAAVYLDGIQMVDNVTIDGGIKLTFEGTQTADNPDLKFFNPGDVVQGTDNSNVQELYLNGVALSAYAGSRASIVSTDTAANTMTVSGGSWIGSDGSISNVWNQDAVWSAPPIFQDNGRSDFNGRVIQKLFNGEPAGGDIENGAMPNGGRWNLNFTQFPNAKTVKIKGRFEANSLIWINGTGSTGTNIPNSLWGAATGENEFSYDVTGTGFVSLEWSGSYSTNNHAVLYSIKVDGYELVDNGIAGAPTGDTEVTGPEKSGTGNFAGNTGVVVDVSNSNHQWIDTTNRLGKEFFIKAASTRTGLAILRTKAIKAGTEIAQAVSDIKDGEFAIVDNNYWFKDEDTLIDLGPVNLPSK